MTWTISCGTGVTLPFGPNQTQYSGAAKVEVFSQESTDPILIVDGLDATTLELQGVFFDCWDSVISPLLGFQGKEVALTTTDGDLDGTYILVSMKVNRQGAAPKWTYNMKLQKGSTHVIL